jgi:transcriptional regulator with XRE-family HTH domain
MTDTTNLFGKNLRSQIKAKGLTFGRAAELFDISLSFLNQLMIGERNPSVETINSICAVLEVSRASLFEEEPIPSGETMLEFSGLKKRVEDLEELIGASKGPKPVLDNDAQIAMLEAEINDLKSLIGRYRPLLEALHENPDLASEFEDLLGVELDSDGNSEDVV